MSGAGQGRFAGSGTVGRYWQTRCRGFEVRSARGRRLGTVEALELEPDTAAAAVLLVRRRGRQSVLRVRPESITLVDPWERSLVVKRPRRRIAAPAWPLAAAKETVRGARTAGGEAVRVARGSRRVAPPAWRFVLALGRRAVLAVALAAWLYAAVVGTVARFLGRILLVAAAATLRGAGWTATRVRRAGVRLHRHLAREWQHDSPDRPPLRT